MNLVGVMVKFDLVPHDQSTDSYLYPNKENLLEYQDIVSLLITSFYAHLCVWSRSDFVARDFMFVRLQCSWFL